MRILYTVVKLKFTHLFTQKRKKGRKTVKDEKLTKERKEELLRKHYERVWYLQPYDPRLVMSVSGTDILVYHRGREHLFSREMSVSENGYIHCRDRMSLNESLVTYLFVENSAEPVDLVRAWMETNLHWYTHYDEVEAEAKEAGYYVIAALPYFHDITFCTVVVHLPCGNFAYLHADDGDWRISTSPDWRLLEEDDPTGKTFGCVELPTPEKAAERLGFNQ